MDTIETMAPTPETDTIPYEEDERCDLTPEAFDAAFRGTDSPEEGAVTAGEGTGDDTDAPAGEAAAVHGDDIPYKFDHTTRQLPRAAVESIAAVLGTDAAGVVTALQKGAGYDRLRERYNGLAGGAPREWVDFFLENPQYAADTVPAAVLDAVRRGGTIQEGLLQHRLAEAERQLQSERQQHDRRARAMGSVRGEVGDTARDPLAEAFESAFR